MGSTVGRVMVSVTALLAVACSSSPSDRNSDESPSQTTQLEQTSGVSDELQLDPLTDELASLRESNGGYLPLQAVLDVFASTFGEVPGGDPNKYIGVDTSLAVHGIGHYWDELTTEQQIAVQARLGYPPKSSLVSAGLPLPDPALQREIDGMRATMASHLGDVPFPIVGYMLPELVREDLAGNPIPDADGNPVPIGGSALPERDGTWAASGQPDRCVLRFPENDPLTAEDVAHEVFHCFSFFLAGDLATFFSAQSWITEGSADWAANAVAGTGPNVRNHFEQWVLSRRSLYSMSYEAIGVYWVIDSYGVSPWDVIDDMLLARSGVAAVAASGLDPIAVLSRATTSKSRARTVAGSSVSEIWDFSSARVPDGAEYFEARITPATGLREDFSLPAFATAPAGIVNLVGGSIVQVAVTGEVGNLQFAGQAAPIEWSGNLVREFCLEEGGCACASDGSGEMPPGTRDLIVAGGQFSSGGPVAYDIRIPDIAFTDGSWAGTIVATDLTIGSDVGTGYRPGTESPIEFTVVSGVVTEGSYSLEFPGIFETPLGTAQGVVVIGGRVTGCGFSPKLEPTSILIDATVTLANGETGPMQVDLDLAGGVMTIQQPVGPPVTAPIASGPSAPTGFTSWFVQPTSTPTRRLGDLDATAELAVLAAAGFAVDNGFFVFDISRA